jgi:hypothetical protein
MQMHRSTPEYHEREESAAKLTLPTGLEWIRDSIVDEAKAVRDYNNIALRLRRELGASDDVVDTLLNMASDEKRHLGFVVGIGVKMDAADGDLVSEYARTVQVEIWKAELDRVNAKARDALGRQEGAGTAIILVQCDEDVEAIVETLEELGYEVPGEEEGPAPEQE